MKTQWIALLTLIVGGIGVAPAPALGQSESADDSPAAIQQAFQSGKQLSASGNFYGAASTFFNVYTAPGSHQDAALAYLTENLIRAGFPNAASYFFIKTLQSGNRGAIRRVLPFLPYMLQAVGGDLLRKYVVHFTTDADYDANTKTHFYYFLGKDELLKGDPNKALQALQRVTSGAGILAQANYLRGSAYAMIGQTGPAEAAFRTCRSIAGKASSPVKALAQEYFDLEARCAAGVARVQYQAGRHDLAEETYDDIPKASFVWTDILFEQAWNSYAKGDYNRALGKLVTYRSPSLEFVFNPEVDILRAQSFLALCAYEDVNRTVNEFNSRYAGVGAQMKDFLLKHDRDLPAFYALARQAAQRKLHTTDMLSRALNRFARGPYFASLMVQERAVGREYARVQQANSVGKGGKFGGFLEKVLGWRGKTVHMLGGVFVKNSLYDLYQELLGDLDKMSFIKLEMLNRTKLTLEKKQVMSNDEEGVLKRGAADISRKDYQYFWTFNGEFWADELGDYVFALESQCGS